MNESRWRSLFIRIELIAIALVFLSQIFVATVQHVPLSTPGLIVCNMCLLLAAASNWLLSAASTRQQRLAVLLVQLLLVAGATATGIAAGFQLLLLVLAAKAGATCGRRAGWAFGIAAAIAYVGCVALNPETAIQGSTQAAKSGDFFQILLSRDALAFLISLGAVLVTVDAVVAEENNRKQLEVLARRLDELSAEIERTRIADSISTSVNHSLETVYSSLVTAWQSKPETAEPALLEAKEVAGESIQQIRSALVMMRTD